MKTAMAVGIVLSLTGTAALYAQQPGFTRKMLQDQNLSVSDRHAVQVVAEFVPGGAAGKHTHPGEELGYVLEGTLQLEVAGEAPRTLDPGGGFFISAGAGRDGKNTRGGPAKAVAASILGEGKSAAPPAHEHGTPIFSP